MESFENVTRILSWTAGAVLLGFEVGKRITDREHYHYDRQERANRMAIDAHREFDERVTDEWSDLNRRLNAIEERIDEVLGHVDTLGKAAEEDDGGDLFSGPLGSLLGATLAAAVRERAQEVRNAAESPEEPEIGQEAPEAAERAHAVKGTPPIGESDSPVAE